MDELKHTCPHCGQHIAFTEAHSGLQVPCPRCQTAIIFPGLAAPRQGSTLRLIKPIVGPRKRFGLADILRFLGQFKHWKTVGVCLVPFLLVVGALWAASVTSHHDTTTATVAPVATETVDPNALDKLTDSMRADQAVKEKLVLVQDESANCKTIASKMAAMREQHSAAGAATLKSLTASNQRAQERLAAVRRSFEATFAQYQKLGGTVDYRSQIQ